VRRAAYQPNVETIDDRFFWHAAILQLEKGSRRCMSWAIGPLKDSWAAGMKECCFQATTAVRYCAIGLGEDVDQSHIKDIQASTVCTFVVTSTCIDRDQTTSDS